MATLRLQIHTFFLFGLLFFLSIARLTMSSTVSANLKAISLLKQGLVNWPTESESPNAYCDSLKFVNTNDNVEDCSSPRTCYLSGVDHLASGKWDLAISNFARSIPDVSSDYYRGWAFWCKGSSVLATDAWRGHGGAVGTLFQKLGEKVLQANKPHEALQWLTLAYSIQPPSVRTMDLIGSAYAHMNNMAQAAEWHNLAIRTGNASANVYFNAAFAEYNLGQIEEAQHRIETAISLDKTAWIYRQLYGAILIAHKNWALAEFQFQTVINAQPAYSDAYAGLAISLLQQRRTDQAQSALQQAVDLANNAKQRASYFLVFADNLSLVGEREKSLEYYQLALANAPDSIEAITGLTKLYVTLNRCQEARDMFYQLVSKSGQRHQELLVAVQHCN